MSAFASDLPTASATEMTTGSVTDSRSETGSVLVFVCDSATVSESGSLFGTGLEFASG
jgi:hypothetical protein